MGFLLFIFLALSTSSARAVGNFSCVAGYLSADERRNPTLFYEAFREGNPYVNNVFGWPLLEESLRNLRDHLARLRSPRDITSRIQPLRDEIDRAFRDRRLNYGRLLAMTFEMLGHVEWGNTGRDISEAVGIAQSDVARLVSEGGVLLPIFQDTPLSQQEILRLSVAGVQPIQIVSEATEADGSWRTPFLFAEHDLVHAFEVNDSMPRRFSRGTDQALRDPTARLAARREGHRILTEIVDAAGRISESRLREDVMWLLFDFARESSNRANTFASILSNPFRGRAAPVDFPAVPGEIDAQFRERYDAAARWLLNALAPHLP